MANLFGIGLSGLGAAQAGLATTSGNISNVNTPGYTRRQASLSEVAGSRGEPGGVRVDGVQRQYAQFLSDQLNAAQSTLSGINSHLDEISQIDDLLSDSEAGLAPRMQDFFDGMAKLADSPEDMAVRNAVLGDAKDLASRFRAFSDTLSKKGGAVDQEISQAVDELNNYTSQIAHLNDQITATRAQTGAEPNELLDKRDHLVAEASQLADVDVTVNDDGNYNLTLGNRALVDVTGNHALATRVDPNDASRQQLVFKGPGGNLHPIGHDQIQGGKIGGLLDFKANSLTPAQLKLDQTAHDFAAALNAQHMQGTDLNGNGGGKLFTTSEPQVYAGADNGGDATLTATFADGEMDSVTASNYRVEYSDGEYQVTRADNGAVVASGDGSSSLSFGGISLDFSGTQQDGDVFTVRPVAGAASAFEVVVSDPAELAAGQDGEVGDNRNASAMAALQQAPVVEGNRSLADNYAQLVGDIGNQTQSLQVNADSQQAVVDEVSQAQQSVAGVNLDEAYVNLMFYQQMYQANARVINTASTVFDAVLSLTH